MAGILHENATDLGPATAVLVAGQIARAQILNTNIASSELTGFLFGARIKANLSVRHLHAVGPRNGGDKIVAAI